MNLLVVMETLMLRIKMDWADKENRHIKCRLRQIKTLL
jgi:hypothetical protein